MKKLVRGILSDVSYGAIRLAGRAGSGLRVLTYHRVTDAHPGDRLCVPAARFAEQMRYLKEAGYQTVTMGEVMRWAESAQPSPAKRVAITFDDGFEDNFLYAFPELLLVIMALLLLLGRYTGFRLTELWRFHALRRKEKTP